jgi:hypothetical protein
MCKIDGCITQPSYNYYGKKAIYCFNHKLDGMINVNIKKCNYENCNKIPSFNYPNETICLYCKQHKLEGMVDIKHNYCNHPNCNKRPNYNYVGEKKRLYCKEHKLDGMIDINAKKCKYTNCQKSPSYNFTNEQYPIYCKEHKLEGMENIRKKTCLHPSCKTIPSYNYPKQTKSLYCAIHKLDGMIDVKNKLCQYRECKLRAIYSLPNERNFTFCSRHKQPGMIDMNSMTCKSEWCTTFISNKKYDGYCVFCYIHLFPDKLVARNYKTKEYSVIEFVKQEFQQYDWITDKMVQEGCSKRRPDLMLDLGYQVLIIEIDENQHIGYDCSCENKRLMELSRDVGHRPIIFIRFNPDDYINYEHKNITSCWGVNQKGICVVKKSKQKEWNERLNTLKTQIEYWLIDEHITNKTVEIIHLFYDVCG